VPQGQGHETTDGAKLSRYVLGIFFPDLVKVEGRVRYNEQNVYMGHGDLCEPVAVTVMSAIHGAAVIIRQAISRLRLGGKGKEKTWSLGIGAQGRRSATRAPINRSIIGDWLIW